MKTKRINDSEWKPITSEGTLLSNGIEGLIGIEELTDYRLERNSKKGKIDYLLLLSIYLATCDQGHVERRMGPERNRTWNLSITRPRLYARRHASPQGKIITTKVKSAKKKKPLRTQLTMNMAISKAMPYTNNKNLAKINIEAWSSIGVPTTVIKALADQNFHSPTAIQAQTLPAAILGRRDILGAAETGSGKTLAFGIPIIKGILDLKKQELEIPVSKETIKYDSQNSHWSCSKSNMQQRQRLKNLERFQADENGLLIATDVAARGLDIPNIEHVIHYQVPRTSENYVHRSGRTARAEKEGITVLMMEPSEKQNYSKLCKTLGRTHDLPTFPVVDRLLISVKERVDVARDIDKLELKCRRQNTQKSWLRKAMEDMDMILDDDDDDNELSTESEEATALRRQLKVKRSHLRSLLSKPVFPKGFSGKYLDDNLNINSAQDTEKAIEVMKKAIENNSRKRKENNIVSQKRKRLQKELKKSTKFKKT
ncbi:LOW QUALITY PROTEIN: ATP-dependent RNA helicase ddx24-like [Formica exsecta]|uniref:LOW QUALITY PROTEIN: ATP-dependent RNA helicase ddx24-like n=1 Tax=Formica exsecta TaxID=72781 RepID=UPI0011428927|nr:LOW QUALITY PROTEIN: ATP-dependent RNA helicase ddx24-like [Formica exsecta]